MSSGIGGGDGNYPPVLESVVLDAGEDRIQGNGPESSSSSSSHSTPSPPRPISTNDIPKLTKANQDSSGDRGRTSSLIPMPCLDSSDSDESESTADIDKRVRILKQSLKDAKKLKKVAARLPKKKVQPDESEPAMLSASRSGDDHVLGPDVKRYKTKRNVKRLAKLGTGEYEITIDKSNRYMAELDSKAADLKPEVLRNARTDPDDSSDSEESDTEGEEALCCEDLPSCPCVCRRRTPKDICCYSPPYIPVLLAPYLFTNIVLFILWGVFWNWYPEVDIDGVHLYSWALCLIIWVNAYLAFLVVFHFILIILTVCCISTKFLFYSLNMDRPLSMLVWSVLVFFLWKKTLVGAHETTIVVMEKLADFILVIAVLYVIKVILTKILIGTQNRQYWWDRISESFYKEKVLEKLIKGPIPHWRQLHAQSKAENARSSSTRKHMHSYEMFDKLANKLRRLNRMKITVKTRRTDPLGDRENLPRWHARHIDRTYGRSDDAREQAATLVAKKLFQKLVSSRNGPKFLAVSDFYPYFESERDAMHAYAVFNETAAHKGFVTESEMIECVNLIYHGALQFTVHSHYPTIARNLKDRDHIGGVVSKILNTILFLIFLIAALVILEVDFTNIVLPISSILLSLSFAFSNAVSDAFSAFVFVVFVNAYNVGDLIEFDGDFAYVKEITLLTTRMDTIMGKRAIASNVYMASNPVYNYSRSIEYAFEFFVHINMDTPTENIKEFIRRLETYAELRPQTWSDIWIMIDSIEHSQTLVLDVFCTLTNVEWEGWHFSTPQTHFMLFVQRQMRDLGIVGHMAPQPVVVRKERTSKKERQPAVYKKKQKPSKLMYSPPITRKSVHSAPLRRRLSEGHESSSTDSDDDERAHSLPPSPRELVETLKHKED